MARLTEAAAQAYPNSKKLMPTLLTLARIGFKAIYPDEETVDEWERATTSGPRKAFDEHPPEGEGWERDLDRGRNGWERFDYHEEAYWKRRRADRA